MVTKYFKRKEDLVAWHDKIRKELSDDSLDGEEWVPIYGFSRYEASSLGRIRSLNYKNSGACRVISACTTADGYLKSVFVNDKGIYKNSTIHRLVCVAFHGYNKGLEVNHIDGNKKNNNPSNLEWCTRSENAKHAIINGLWTVMSGESNGMAKLTVKDVEYIRRRKKEGGRYWGRNEIAKELGVSEKHIQHIANNENITWHRN